LYIIIQSLVSGLFFVELKGSYEVQQNARYQSKYEITE